MGWLVQDAYVTHRTQKEQCGFIENNIKIMRLLICSEMEQPSVISCMQYHIHQMSEL